jgi:hypothetical protein
MSRMPGQGVAARDSVRPSCRPSTNTLFTCTRTEDGVLRFLRVCPSFKVRSASSRSPRPNDRWRSCLEGGASSFGLSSELSMVWIDKIEMDAFSHEHRTLTSCLSAEGSGRVGVCGATSMAAFCRRTILSRNAFQVLKLNVLVVTTRKSISCRKTLLASGYP